MALTLNLATTFNSCSLHRILLPFMQKLESRNKSLQDARIKTNIPHKLKMEVFKILSDFKNCKYGIYQLKKV